MTPPPAPPPLRINRLHHPVTALGTGVRAGIWVQGCTIGCPGCASRDTWDPAAGDDITPSVVLRWLDTLPDPLDGVTISGGEPFQQPTALTAMLAALDGWRHARERAREFDLLVFSGYPWPLLAARPEHAQALALCDAVVAGPYIERRNSGTPLRGSNNQQIVALTDLGRDRYGNPDALPAATLQIFLDGDTVRLIGIPHRGELDRMRASLHAWGIAVESITWHG